MPTAARRELDTPLGVTVNDGSATVSFPGALSSSTVRLMIKAQGNIFFDISDLDFTLAAVASPPGAPTITSIEPDDTGLLVRFAPGSDGGSPITGYTVTCDGFSQAGDNSPITLLGLTNDQEYSCTVVAMNAIGISAASSPASGTPQEMIPSGLPVWLLYKAIENQGS